MTCGDLIIAATQYMWIDADAYRNISPIFVPEFLQNGYVVDIDPHTKFNRLIDLLDGDTVGCVEDVLWGESRLEAQLHLLHRYCIQARTQSLSSSGFMCQLGMSF